MAPRKVLPENPEFESLRLTDLADYAVRQVMDSQTANGAELAIALNAIDLAIRTEVAATESRLKKILDAAVVERQAMEAALLEVHTRLDLIEAQLELDAKNFRYEFTRGKLRQVLDAMRIATLRGEDSVFEKRMARQLEAKAPASTREILARQRAAENVEAIQSLDGGTNG